MENLVARAVNPPAGKICYFRPLLHNVILGDTFALVVLKLRNFAKIKLDPP